MVQARPRVGLAELDKWRASCATALADPEDMRTSPPGTRAGRKRNHELERELLRKDRALAETAALLVSPKQVAAIFDKGEDERATKANWLVLWRQSGLLIVMRPGRGGWRNCGSAWLKSWLMASKSSGGG